MKTKDEEEWACDNAEKFKSAAVTPNSACVSRAGGGVLFSSA